MTTADDLKSFFETDVVSLLSSFSTPDTPIAYAGQGERKGVGSFEVQVKYTGEIPVNEESGQYRHLFDLVLRIHGNDNTAEDTLSTQIDNAAKTLARAYQASQYRVGAAISKSIERVRAYRTPSIKMAMSNKTRYRAGTVKVEVDEWL